MTRKSPNQNIRDALHEYNDDAKPVVVLVEEVVQRLKDTTESEKEMSEAFLSLLRAI